jgi:putative transposase
MEFYDFTVEEYAEYYHELVPEHKKQTWQIGKQRLKTLPKLKHLQSKTVVASNTDSNRTVDTDNDITHTNAIVDDVDEAMGYSIAEPEDDHAVTVTDVVESTVPGPAYLERDITQYIDLVPKEIIPYRMSKSAKLMGIFCQMALARLADSESKLDAWKQITASYNHKQLLPELYDAKGKRDERSLRRWVESYQSNNSDMYALVRKTDGCNRPRKVTYFEQNFLLNLLLNPNNIKIGSAISSLKSQAALKLCESPTDERTLRRWCEEYRANNPAIWGQATLGSKFVSERIVKTIQRDSGLLKVGSVWVADGHTLAFDIINPNTGKAQRMTLILVLDWASRYPVGASLALTEDSAHIQTAFRNGFLNWGALPNYVYLDNGKAFRSKLFNERWESHDLEMELGGIFPRLNIGVAFAESYNAKAKVIERFFKTLQEQFERFISSFRGSCIADKPATLMRNEKWAKKLFEAHPPTLEETMQMIGFYIRYVYGETPHAALKGKTPYQVFSSATLPADRLVEPSRLNFMMLAAERKAVRNDGIVLNKLRYWDAALVDQIGKPVVIRYDHSDARWILVYDLQDRFICQAELRQTQHPFIHLALDQPVAHKHLNQEYNHIKKLRRGIEQKTKYVVRHSQEVVDATLKPLLAAACMSNNPTFIQPPMIMPPQPGPSQEIERIERICLPDSAKQNIDNDNMQPSAQDIPRFEDLVLVPKHDDLITNQTTTDESTGTDSYQPKPKSFDEMLKFIGIK